MQQMGKQVEIVYSRQQTEGRNRQPDASDSDVVTLNQLDQETQRLTAMGPASAVTFAR